MEHIANHVFDTSSGLCSDEFAAKDLSPSRLKNKKSNGLILDAPSDEDDFVQSTFQPAEHRTKRVFLPNRKQYMIEIPNTPASGSSSSRQSYGNFDREWYHAGDAIILKNDDRSLMRRPEVYISEISAMATMQAGPVDSTTVPRRSLMHERLEKMQNSSWLQHTASKNMFRGVSGEAFDRSAKMAMHSTDKSHERTSSYSATLKQVKYRQRRQLPPPGALGHLVVSSFSPLPQLLEQESMSDEIPGTCIQSESTRMPILSPALNGSAFKQSRTSSKTPKTLATSIFSTKSRPNQTNSAPSDCTNSYLEPVTELVIPNQRVASETDKSIVGRSQTKKRLLEDPSKCRHSASIIQPVSQDHEASRTLPLSCSPTVASSLMSADEIEALKKQAIGEAKCFGVLSSKDVLKLSQELHILDERCEYLYKTLRSLSSGRRDLLERIHVYLCSPRLAQFSCESLLKQEEAISELNVSIDDWITKCQRAENRRIRVREKLLEHVAAALMLVPRI